MIKVKKSNNDNNKKPFPKIMQGISESVFRGRLVLFVSSGSGLSITNPGGGFATNYNMDYFTDYNEPVTIQNA